VSNPRSFSRDPRFGWGFFGHRYSLYAAAVPHDGYCVLRRWAERCPSFTFTSNVDGAFLKAGLDPERVVECHGSIHHLQLFDALNTDGPSPPIWPAEPQLLQLRVDLETFLADADTIPHWRPEEDSPPTAGLLCRPNILMFGDRGWVPDRTAAQEARLEAFLATLPRDSRLVVIEVGAGTEIPTVRLFGEDMLDTFPHSTLIRINPGEPGVPRDEERAGRAVAVPAGGRSALVALDAALGGAAGVGCDVARAL
jgi:NAD-dependent SIR2 family protein deacetylase